MQKTLTIILADNGQVQVVPGGEWNASEIVAVCQAVVAGQVRALNEELDRVRQSPNPAGGE